MPADLKIQVGVTSRVRQWDITYKPTISYTNTFNYDTTTDLYTGITPQVGIDVLSYITSELGAGAVVSVHFAVWLDNPTHPPTSAGVIRLPKGHRDSAMTSQEASSAAVIQHHLEAVCLNLKNTAKY